MGIDACTRCTPRWNAAPSHARDVMRLDERLRVATATRESDATLRVVTDDGDVLTLTAHQESSATYSDLRRTSRGPEGRVRERLQVFEASSRQGFSIEIEGTLDDEERADLEALIQRVAAAFRRFEQGDLEGADALVRGRGPLDSLDSFSVRFEREQVVSVAESVRRTLAIGEHEDRAALPARAPEAPLPATPALPIEAVATDPGAGPARRHGRSECALARATAVLEQLLDRLSTDRPGVGPQRAVEVFRAMLAGAAPGQDAPAPMPMTAPGAEAVSG